MLSTFNRSEWGESKEQEQDRERLWAKSTPDDIRKHFPYEGIIRKDCKSYGFNTGQVLTYCRVRVSPQFYPIEAFTIGQDNSVRRCFFGSEEIQLREL